MNTLDPDRHNLGSVTPRTIGHQGHQDSAVLHNSRDKSSFAYAQEIVKPWGGLEPVLEWCKKELQEDWRWQMVEMSTDQRPGRYIFYFDGERDCCAFALKWC